MMNHIISTSNAELPEIPRMPAKGEYDKKRMRNHSRYHRMRRKYGTPPLLWRRVLVLTVEEDFDYSSGRKPVPDNIMKRVNFFCRTMEKALKEIKEFSYDQRARQAYSDGRR